MHAAKPGRSQRLQRVISLLARGGWFSTMEIIRQAQVAAVNSIISELRAGGAVITCRRRKGTSRPVWEYCMTEPPPAEASAPPPIRRRLLAAIHARAKEIGLDEDARRASHHAATGKRSCAHMSEVELRRALDALPKPAPRLALVNSAADESRRKMLGKIHAQCHALGVSRQYAESIARQMHQSPLGDLTPPQLRAVITALTRHQAKVG